MSEKLFVTFTADWTEDRPFPEAAARKRAQERERFFVSADQGVSGVAVVERSTWECKWYPCRITECHLRLIEWAGEQVLRMPHVRGKHVMTVPRSVAIVLNQRMVLELKEPREARLALAA